MKDNRDNGDGDKSHRKKTATDAAGIRDSSKRTADRAGMNKGGECMHRLERARRTDQRTGPSSYGAPQMTLESLRYNRQGNLNEDESVRSLSRPKPVFRWPPSLRNFQQREKYKLMSIQ